MAGWKDAPLVDEPAKNGSWKDAPVVGETPALTQDYFLQLAREQFPKPDLQEGQVIEGNPQASQLPGPLGQFANTLAASQAGQNEGVLGNFSNEIYSGATAIPRAAINAMQGKGFDIPAAFNEAYQRGNETQSNQMALNPEAARKGSLLGSLVLGKSLGGLTPSTASPVAAAGLGALEGGAYGAVYGAGGAEGNDRLMAALKMGGEGALGGAVIGGAANAFQQPVSQESRLIAKALERDRIIPGSVASRVAALGPDAVIADIGPNLQGQSAAIATLPGPGSARITDALKARRAGANDRIKTGVDSAIGPAPRLSEVAGDIDAARAKINTQYEPVFRAKALSNDPFTDITPVVNSIDTRIAQTVGETKAALQKAKRLLVDEAGNPLQDPQMIMAARQDLDGIIGSETNRTIKNALKDLRRNIDTELGASVPGLKNVDAQFAEVAKQSDALDKGRNILDEGKTTAIDPADLVDEMLTASPGQNARLSQGARIEINRIIGTKGSDRVALKNIVRGEGSWNYDKLKAAFGEKRANDLLRVVDNEATLAETENLATSGSRTQVLKAAQDELNAKTDSGILREAGNLQFGSAAGRIADKLLNGVVSKRREVMVDRIAEALMSGTLTPKMTVELNRLTNGLSARDKQIIGALTAGQASQ